MGRKHSPKKSELFGHELIIGMGIVLVVLFSGVFYKVLHSNPTRSGQTVADAIPVYYSRPEDAMPFPATLEPEAFRPTDVREAYRVAKEIPGILAQQPCYCYCQRKGHRGLLDCFKTDHAASCDICVKEALLASQMHRQGKSAQEIRTAIIQGQWASLGNPSQRQ
jgi:Protein of unknown function with PCYCGC motif